MRTDTASKKTRRKRPGGGELFDPSIQLENLHSRLEGGYQRLVVLLSKSLPGALAIFLLVTLLEGWTGVLAQFSGRVWLEKFGRLPSSLGGQGILSSTALMGMVKSRFEQNPPRVVMVGDSVLSPNMGGGTGNDMPIEKMMSSQIPDTLNIAQEGGEWGTSALIIEKLIRDPMIQARKPFLVFDVNFKFFGTTRSFTPAFPIEVELCADPLVSGDERLIALCRSLSIDWPPALREISRYAPLVARGLLGQFDLFMTFVQRAPIYGANHRGWGFDSIRAFRPGLSDALETAEAYRRRAPPEIHYMYRGLEKNMNRYLGIITGGYLDSLHPKHQWMRALASAVSRWPGPVIGLWIHPSPEAEKVLNEENKKRIDAMRTGVLSLFRDIGRRDLQMISTRDMLNEWSDYFDSDHPSVNGHRKLASFISQMVRP